MDEAQKQSVAGKLIGIGVALAAAWAAQQVLNAVWTTALGHKPPKPDDPGDARFAEIAAAAMLTAGLVALARLLATRGAAKYVR